MSRRGSSLDTGLFGGLIAYNNAIEMDYFELFGELKQHDRGFVALRPLTAGVLTDRRPTFAELPEGAG